MAKKERRGRNKLNQKKTNKKIKLTTTPPNKVGYGNLYKSPTQHLTVDDPNTIFLSATTPTANVLRYILQQLTTVAATNHQKIIENCVNHPALNTNINDIPTDDLPPLDTVTIMAVNYTVQRAVSIVEILKRRIPTLLTSIQIGMIDNTPRLQTNTANTNKQNNSKLNTNDQDSTLLANIPPTLTQKQNKKNTKKQQLQLQIEQQKELSLDATKKGEEQPQQSIEPPKLAQLAYAMKITLLVKQTLQPIDITADADDEDLESAD